VFSYPKFDVEIRRIVDVGSLSIVTGTIFGPVRIISRTSGSGRRNSSPRPEGFLSQDAERAAGCEMALDIESVSEGGMNGEESLG
jgi:hypothetical protein